MQERLILIARNEMNSYGLVCGRRNDLKSYLFTHVRVSEGYLILSYLIRGARWGKSGLFIFFPYYISH